MNRSRPSVLIRADASSRIGMGHVMRCLALAEVWQERDGDVTFAMSEGAPLIEPRLRHGRLEAISITAVPGSEGDARQTGLLAKERSVSWVVTDGYRFDSKYQESLRERLNETGCRLLCIDDFRHASHYFADAVLDQSISIADQDLYADREAYTTVLAGSDYVLLRREFRKWRETSREIECAPAKRLLVTLGGGGNSIIPKIVRAVARLGRYSLECKIVIGPGFESKESLELIGAGVRQGITLLHSVIDMPELMAWADLAICGAGSTAWEMAFMGLPALLVILADNQEPLAERLDRQGVARSIGWHYALSDRQIAAELERLVLSPERRLCMSAVGRKMTDGRGAERVADYMQGTRFKLRPVTDADCEVVWKWANDAKVRSGSFCSEPIEWGDHVRWFGSRMNDPHCVFQMIVDDTETQVGQLRHEIRGSEAVVSIGLAETYRGKGLGSRVLRAGGESLFESTDVEVIHAYIKTDNDASERAFLKAGFVRLADEPLEGQSAAHLVLRRSPQKC